MSYIQINETGRDSLTRVNKILAGVPGGAIKAAQSALKRAADTAKTKSGQFAAAEYTINKGTFMANTTMKTEAAGGFGGVASMTLSYAGSPIPLLTFNTKYARDGHITTQVKRGSSGGVLERAFISRTYGIAVVQRLGRERFPIESMFGPGTSKMMGNEEIVEKMDETIRTTFESRLEHEILRILSGWGG